MTIVIVTKLCHEVLGNTKLVLCDDKDSCELYCYRAQGRSASCKFAHANRAPLISYINIIRDYFILIANVYHSVEFNCICDYSMYIDIISTLF